MSNKLKDQNNYINCLINYYTKTQKIQILLRNKNNFYKFSNNYFMQTDRIQKDKIINLIEAGPKRSFSYNDLKKKRLLRSQKSKTKLKLQGQEQIIVRTEKKRKSQNFSIGISATSSKPYDQKKIEKSLLELKEIFSGIKQSTKQKKYIISKPFYSDRNSDNNSKSFLKQQSFINDKKNSFISNIEMAGYEKQLIKKIISKKKSQRRLLKFEQIRDQVKRSKSKSKQKSKLFLADQETAPNSKANNSISLTKVQRQKSMKNIRVKKFQTVRQPNANQIFRSCNTEVVNREHNIDQSEKRRQNLGLKNHQSRRKLKVIDFKSQAKMSESQNTKSLTKLKFHRKLRKTNSQIIIKTKQILLNRQTKQNKYHLTKSQSSQSQRNQDRQNLRQKDQVQRKRQKQMRFFSINANKQEQKFSQQFQILKNQNKSDNLLREFQISAINISQIQIKKDQSLLDIQSQLNLVQAIQDQQIQLQMNKHPKNHEQENKFKKSKGQSPTKHGFFIQNAENIENLSNILDLVALPTKQLKVKIYNKQIKKKNQLEKFKKIFPTNFFNN